MASCYSCKKRTPWFCYVHKRSICDDCTVNDSLIEGNSGKCQVNCVIGNYFDWIADGDYEWPSRCHECNHTLQSSTSQVIRLTCRHSYHKTCLAEMVQKANGSVASCRSCSKPVLDLMAQPKTKLRDTLQAFIQNPFASTPATSAPAAAAPTPTKEVPTSQPITPSKPPSSVSTSKSTPASSATSASTPATSAASSTSTSTSSSTSTPAVTATATATATESNAPRTILPPRTKEPPAPAQSDSVRLAILSSESFDDDESESNDQLAPMVQRAGGGRADHLTRTNSTTNTNSNSKSKKPKKINWCRADRLILLAMLIAFCISLGLYFAFTHHMLTSPDASSTPSSTDAAAAAASSEAVLNTDTFTRPPLRRQQAQANIRAIRAAVESFGGDRPAEHDVDT